jgi:hypothetical protein
MSMNPQQRQFPGPEFNGQPANPSWMGHVQPQNYRPAPGHSGGTVDQVIPEAASTVAARPGAGTLGLVVAGGILAFVSLFLVVPFLLASTGVTGFVIGFVASLIPLAAVLTAEAPAGFCLHLGCSRLHRRDAAHPAGLRPGGTGHRRGVLP